MSDVIVVVVFALLTTRFNVAVEFMGRFVSPDPFAVTVAVKVTFPAVVSL